MICELFCAAEAALTSNYKILFRQFLYCPNLWWHLFVIFPWNVCTLWISYLLSIITKFIRLESCFRMFTMYRLLSSQWKLVSKICNRAYINVNGSFNFILHRSYELTSVGGECKFSQTIIVANLKEIIWCSSCDMRFSTSRCRIKLEEGILQSII